MSDTNDHGDEDDDEQPYREQLSADEMLRALAGIMQLIMAAVAFIFAPAYWVPMFLVPLSVLYLCCLFIRTSSSSSATCLPRTHGIKAHVRCAYARIVTMAGILFLMMLGGIMEVAAHDVCDKSKPGSCPTHPFLLSFTGLVQIGMAFLNFFVLFSWAPRFLAITGDSTTTFGDSNNYSDLVVDKQHYAAFLDEQIRKKDNQNAHDHKVDDEDEIQDPQQVLTETVPI